MPKLLAKTGRIIVIPSRQSLDKPLGDHSGQGSQPFWHGVRGRSGRSLFKALSGP